MIKPFRNSDALKSGRLVQKEVNFSNDPSNDEVKMRQLLKTEANKCSTDKEKDYPFVLKIKVQEGRFEALICCSIRS